MKKKSTYLDQTVDELNAQYKDLSKDIFQLKNELALNRKIEKPHLIKAKKKERARILTAVHQKASSITQ